MQETASWARNVSGRESYMNVRLVGRRIKEVRMNRKIAQSVLAEKCNISVSYMSHIERGTKTASADVLIRIANALDTTVDVFLSGVQTKDTGSYENEISRLMKGCSQYEKRILYEMITSLLSSLRNNKALIEDEVMNSIQNKW